MANFGSRLKELREEKGFSQQQLANELGISNIAIYYWENNLREPKLGAVITLAKYFKVTLGYMAGLED